ncbi:MAG: hypothetical protein ABEJ80_03735 [Halarchaeum sp.]
MGIGRTLIDAVAGRTRSTVGFVLGAVSVGHFARWTGTDGAGALAGLEGGQLSLAASGFVGYGVAHPAYVLAFVAGVAALASGLRGR